MLNADAYFGWIKKVLGIRSVRHLFPKEVIIHDPDYVRLPAELEALSTDCRAYAGRHKLKQMPNYFKLWTDTAEDQEMEAINARLESLIEEMSNARSPRLIGVLNKYPIVSVRAHVRPFRRYGLNVACGICFPVGLFFFFRIWAFRIRLSKDLERIVKADDDALYVIRAMQKEQGRP